MVCLDGRCYFELGSFDTERAGMRAFEESRGNAEEAGEAPVGPMDLQEADERGRNRRRDMKLPAWPASASPGRYAQDEQYVAAASNLNDRSVYVTKCTRDLNSPGRGKPTPGHRVPIKLSRTRTNATMVPFQILRF